MRRLIIIGIGAGDPRHLTLQAVDALNAVDVFIIPDKGDEKSDLKQFRIDMLERIVREPHYRVVQFDIPERNATPVDYHGAVLDWHERIAGEYRRILEEEVGADETVGLLVWGDPSLYDSTIRIVRALIAGGCAINFEVVPGISSVQALAARHGIALHEIGDPVLVTTGRNLGSQLPGGFEAATIMLDGGQAFTRLLKQDIEIFWGAYLGTENEILMSGPLDDVCDRIVEARRAARARHGWIMDIYHLRKVRRRP